MIPLPSEAVKPQTLSASAFKAAYSVLKAGKLRPKNTGRKVATITPPTLRRNEAMSTLRAVGILNTSARLSMKDLIGFVLALFAASTSSELFFFFCYCFSASERYRPLSGSLIQSAVKAAKMPPTTAMMPYWALQPKADIKMIDSELAPSPT